MPFAVKLPTPIYVRGVSEAETLTDQEVRIITRIAMTFPGNQSILRASHDEGIYKSKSPGELIPYTDAEQLKAVSA